MQYTRIIRKVVEHPGREPLVAVGVDLSLSGTGLAIVRNGHVELAQAWTTVRKLQNDYRHLLCWFRLKPHPRELHKVHRAHTIAEWVLRTICSIGDPHVLQVHVALEGYAFSKRSTGMSDIHELGGMVRDRLWSSGIPFRTYDPGSIKLAWTGDGSAEKPDMISACARRFPDLWRDGLGALAERDVEAAGNIADASLIAALLYEEMQVKAGRMPLENLRERMRRVLLRVTKAEPEALTSRPFACRTRDLPEPVLARPRDTK